MGEVVQALLALRERGATEPVEYDPEWPSPSEVQPPDDRGMVDWWPVPMYPPPATFDGIPVMSKSPLAVAREAVRVAADSLPAYSSPRSRRDFTQHQLLAALALGESPSCRGRS